MTKYVAWDNLNRIQKALRIATPYWRWGIFILFEFFVGWPLYILGVRR